MDDQEIDRARTAATFWYTVKNISKLKKIHLSPVYYVNNLPWKIMVIPPSQTQERNESKKSLGIFLQCNGESKSTLWSCHAVAELCLLSWKDVQDPFSRKIQHLFHSKENDWGFSHFMTWQNVLNPEMGYIKDDSITLEVHIDSDKNRSEATFRYTIEKVSKMKNFQVSPICYVRNLPWSIEVMPQMTDTENGLSEKSLGVYLQCKGKSESRKWSCYAVADLRLLSWKEHEEPFSQKIQHLFFNEGGDWGFDDFIKWQDMLTPEKGYVKDDSITLEVQIEIDEATSEASFQYILKNISNMKHELYSPPFYVRNLPWNIMVRFESTRTRKGQPVKSLAIFLECNKDCESTSWKCHATAEFSIVAWKLHMHEELFTKEFEHCFTSQANCGGCDNFISWQYVVDPRCGYIKDDSIKIQVLIKAEKPEGICLDNKKQRRYIDWNEEDNSFSGSSPSISEYLRRRLLKQFRFASNE